MTRDPAQLEKLLEQSPEDWSLRITLIEERIRRDNQDGAKQLVRESPDDSPLPYDLKYRLHQLMTRGKEVIDPLPEPLNSTILPATEPPAHDVTPVPPESEKVTGSKSEPEPQSLVSKTSPKESEEIPPSTKTEKPDFEEIAPLVKGAAAKAKREEILGLKKQPAKPEIELTKNTSAAKKWDNYRGNLLLTESDIPAPAVKSTKRSIAVEKVSALTAAIIVHLIIIASFSLVAIVQVRQKPPVLIVSAVHEKEVELQTTRLTKTKEKRLSAAAAQPVNVISSIGASIVKVPETEPTPFFSTVAPVTGIAPTGMGMSFTGETDTVSDISFFGISGGGDRVVFVIDATKPMLVDEKGGMFAYDKVKNEIGAMLQGLRRGTFFNILVYDGSDMVAFRKEPVSGLPSNQRKAFEWLAPLNRTYENLGLENGYMKDRIELASSDVGPIQTGDLAHYTKCIQKAMEWQASAIFCIAEGYGSIRQSPTPEMIEEYKDNPVIPGTPGTIDPGAQKAWNEAQQKTREWLKKENEARREKGLPPKVVINFGQLVRQVTGATPPQRTGGTPSSGGMPGLPNHTPEDIEKQVKNLVKKHYKEAGRDEPSVHMVLFLGENEDIGRYEEHFKNLTKENRGKLKALRGLAELEDVTGK